MKGGFSPLHFAVQDGHAAVAKQLIELAVRWKMGALRSTWQPKMGNRPSQSGQPAVTRHLLAARCHVDLQDAYGYTLSCRLAPRRPKSSMKMLIEP